MPGFYIEDYRESQFDAYDFMVQTPKDVGKQHAEGHLTSWLYDIIPAAGTPPSWLQIARNYQNACSGWAARRCTTRGPATTTIRRF